jgi:AraC-like DNA-binding protein/quercetin dioxygenase-like cupin family protein
MSLLSRSPRPPAEDRADVVVIELAGARVEVLRAVYRAQQFPRHSHDAYTIGVGLRGVGSIWYRGATHMRRRDDVVVIPPGEVHTGGVGRESDVLSYLAVYIPADVMSACARANGVKHVDALDVRAPVLRDPLVGRALLTLERVFPRFAADGSMTAAGGCDAPGAQDALACALATFVQRHGGSGRRAHEVDEPRVVRVAREILHARYADPARSSLEAIAAEVEVTAFHLVRAFRRVAGVSPHQYLVQLRIAHARRLLAAGTAPSIAAAMTGFADQSHLTAQFKRYVGITPGRYQRGVRAG